MAPDLRLGNARLFHKHRLLARPLARSRQCELCRRHAGRTGFHGAAVTLGAHGTLPTLKIDGLDKPVSNLALGTDNQIDAPTMAAMADAFVEAGGTCFDTAFIYSGGESEKLLGAWMHARGIRDDLVVLSKGAHTPDCHPEAVGQQLDISLERLQTGLEIFIACTATILMCRYRNGLMR